jgi:hypothetical protein
LIVKEIKHDLDTRSLLPIPFILVQIDDEMVCAGGALDLGLAAELSTT